MQFRVKMKTSMAKVKKTYADRMGLDLKSLRFLFDGNRVNDSDTPKTVCTVQSILVGCSIGMGRFNINAP